MVDCDRRDCWCAAHMLLSAGSTCPMSFITRCTFMSRCFLTRDCVSKSLSISYEPQCLSVHKQTICGSRAQFLFVSTPVALRLLTTPLVMHTSWIGFSRTQIFGLEQPHLCLTLLPLTLSPCCSPCCCSSHCTVGDWTVGILCDGRACKHHGPTVLPSNCVS